MSEILVVSRNTTLAMGLTHHGHEAHDVRPDRFGGWLDDVPGKDILVLELPDPVAAQSAVERLRTAGHRLPVLVVSSQSPGWDALSTALGSAVAVLPLPLSLPALLGAVNDLIETGPIAAAEPAWSPTVDVQADKVDVVHVKEAVGAPSTVPAVTHVPVPPPMTEHELLDSVAATVGLTIDSSGTLVARDEAAPATLNVADASVPVDEDTASIVDALVGDAEADDETAVADTAVDETAWRSMVEHAHSEHPPSEPPVHAARHPLRGRDHRADASIAALASRPAEHVPPRTSPAELVRAVLGKLNDLVSLEESTDVVLAEAVDRTGAEAAALMLPDGEVWRVAGGIELRPLELRLRLSRSDWLIDQVVGGQRGVLIEDSDVGRQRLTGVPMASWQNLMAVPVRAVDGVILLASREHVFDERDLERVAAVAAEAESLLREALDVRALARHLADFADSDE